jgi:hypothetical protein
MFYFFFGQCFKRRNQGERSFSKENSYMFLNVSACLIDRMRLGLHGRNKKPSLVLEID